MSGQGEGTFRLREGKPAWDYPGGEYAIVLDGEMMYYAADASSNADAEAAEAACTPHIPRVARAFPLHFDLTETERHTCRRILRTFDPAEAAASWCEPIPGGVRWYAPGNAVSVKLRGENVTLSLPKSAVPPGDPTFLIQLACWDILDDAGLPRGLHRWARVCLHNIESGDLRPARKQAPGEADAPASCAGAARYCGN